MTALTQAQCDEYHERGFLHLRDALPGALLDSLTAVLQGEVERRARALYAAGEIGDLCAADPFATRWYHVWRQHGGEQERFGWHASVFSRAIYELWLEPAILDAIESLLGPDIQINGDYWVRPKLPGEELTTLPWHQDSAYMPDTAQYHWPAVWLPLVPVTAANGAMQFLPGTHRLPIQPHEQQQGAAFMTPPVDPARGREVVTLERDAARRLRDLPQPRVPPLHGQPRRHGALVGGPPLQPRRHPDGRHVAPRHEVRGAHRRQPPRRADLGAGADDVADGRPAHQPALTAPPCTTSLRLGVYR